MSVMLLPGISVSSNQDTDKHSLFIIVGDIIEHLVGVRSYCKQCLCYRVQSRTSCSQASKLRDESLRQGIVTLFGKAADLTKDMVD